MSSIRENGQIKKVMVVGGSGFRREYIDIAFENDVDALVSGEMRHDAIRYAQGLCLFDATHYGTGGASDEKIM